MERIDFTLSNGRNAVVTNTSPDFMEVTLGRNGGGVSFPEPVGTAKRYIVGSVEVLEEHSVAMMMRFYVADSDSEQIFYRFGLLPGLKTMICLDLELLDNHTIYTNRTPGTLKLVVHGKRTLLKDVVRFELGIKDTFHDVHVRLDHFYLTNELPEDFPVPEKKLVDEFGQWKLRDWPGKVHSFEELKSVMQKNEGPAAYPFSNWDRWGGDTTRKLKEGTGFFSTIKTLDGRWHLADPDGFEYFSLGPCGISPGDNGRVDYLEKLCDWLPEEDTLYQECWQSGKWQRTPYMEPEQYKLFNFGRANIIRVYGDQWRDKWEEMTKHLLMQSGINSHGNSPSRYAKVNRFGKTFPIREQAIPYVCQLLDFPSTETLIFRDFPDVLAPEYQEKAHHFAKQLIEMKNDPWLIGYFMRNEPEFNFVENIVIADEVLSYPKETFCRTGLIEFLREHYAGIDALNIEWNSTFTGFDDFNEAILNCSTTYPNALKVLREFSAKLIREYIRIPSMACRMVDPIHLNLGMRWSKAYNADMMAGWEYYDVFSINCYDFNPTKDMDFVKNAGVDLPILIGEFHCGALDRGLPATGLKGVENQTERGIAWRYFVEQCAAHPYGVAAHWFQYNDQSCLGRFDGENYQIGMIDVCMQPHRELMDAALATSERLYSVKNGETVPFHLEPKSIPMIGY